MNKLITLLIFIAGISFFQKVSAVSDNSYAGNKNYDFNYNFSTDASCNFDKVYNYKLFEPSMDFNKVGQGETLFSSDVIGNNIILYGPGGTGSGTGEGSGNDEDETRNDAIPLGNGLLLLLAFSLFYISGIRLRIRQTRLLIENKNKKQ